FGASADALVERVESALEAYRRNAGNDLAVDLGRRGRAPTAWLEAVVRLGSGADVDHRRAGIAVDRLIRVIEDPTAAEDQRVGAALALRQRIEPDERQRIRIAARASVSPKLRIALERVADEATDEAAL